MEPEKEQSNMLREKIANNLGSGLLNEGENALLKLVQGKRFIDTERIPLICLDISNIHNDIREIKDSMRWITRLVIGAVVMALLGTIFIHKP